MADRLHSFPQRDGYRVHREPSMLLRRGRPLHRFDDPENDFGVWHLTSTLRGSVIWAFESFRSCASANDLLESVKGVEGFDVLDHGEEFSGAVPLSFITSLRIARARPKPDRSKSFVSIADDKYLAQAFEHPRVRAAIDRFGKAPPDRDAVLAPTLPARALTQAIARTAFEDERDLAGIHFISRYAATEDCWAVFESPGRATVDFVHSEALDITNGNHRRAVYEAAEALSLRLPPNWEAAASDVADRQAAQERKVVADGGAPGEPLPKPGTPHGPGEDDDDESDD